MSASCNLFRTVNHAMFWRGWCFGNAAGPLSNMQSITIPERSLTWSFSIGRRHHIDQSSVALVNRSQVPQTPTHLHFQKQVRWDPDVVNWGIRRCASVLYVARSPVAASAGVTPNEGGTISPGPNFFWTNSSSLRKALVRGLRNSWRNWKKNLNFLTAAFLPVETGH